MINNLVKKKQIVNQDAEIQRLKIMLQQNELALLNIAKNLEFQYQVKYNDMWAMLKKKRGAKEFKTLKAEFDSCAKVQARQSRASVQRKTKRYVLTATKSLDGLVRVADTVGQSVPNLEQRFVCLIRDFRFSIANPQTMFDQIIALEVMQTSVTGLLHIVSTCQTEVEKQEEAMKRNMYFSLSLPKKSSLTDNKNNEFGGE